MKIIEKYTPGMLYAQPAAIELDEFRSRLVALGREILGEFADESAAIEAASSTRCWCGRGCIYRCVYQSPRHIGDALSTFHWPGNGMANCSLAAEIGNSVKKRNFDTHLDIGSGGGRTILEVAKVATGSTLLAVEPHAVHRELLRAVHPDAEIHQSIETVSPLRGSRVLVTVAGVLNCIPSSVVDDFVKTISTVGAGSVIATLDFIRAPGRLYEFESKLKLAFGDAIRRAEFQEDDRNSVQLWEVSR